MAAAVPKFFPFAFRGQGLRTNSRVRALGFVCGQCQRQQERRKLHVSTALRRKVVDREEYTFNVDKLEPEERADYNALPPGEQETFRNEHKRIYDVLNSPKAVAELSGLTARAIANTERDAPIIERPFRRRAKPGFWNMGEVEREESGEDEAFEGDDLNELGHAELEQHREMREYARIAAWEMPLLSSKCRIFHHDALFLCYSGFYDSFTSSMFSKRHSSLLTLAPPSTNRTRYTLPATRPGTRSKIPLHHLHG